MMIERGWYRSWPVHGVCPSLASDPVANPIVGSRIDEDGYILGKHDWDVYSKVSDPITEQKSVHL